jgi:hypothetical protein
MKMESCAFLQFSELGVFSVGASMEWAIIYQEGVELRYAGKHEQTVTIMYEWLNVVGQNLCAIHPEVPTTLNALSLLHIAV